MHQLGLVPCTLKNVVGADDMHEVSCHLVELKQEVVQLKQQIGEIKTEMAMSRRSYALHNATLLPACIGCIFGFVVAVLWK